jgi:hypothetical protein
MSQQPSTEETPADVNWNRNRGGNRDRNRSGNQGGNRSGNQGGNRSGNQGGNRSGNQDGNRGGNPRGADPRQSRRNRNDGFIREEDSPSNTAQPPPSADTNRPPSQSEEGQPEQPPITETDDTSSGQLPLEEEQPDPAPASSSGANLGTLEDPRREAHLTEITKEIYQNRAAQPEGERPIITTEFVCALCNHKHIPVEYWHHCVQRIREMEGLNRQTDEDAQRKAQKKKIDIEADKAKVEYDKVKREHRFCASWAAIIAAIFIAVATALPVLEKILSQK